MTTDPTAEQPIYTDPDSDSVALCKAAERDPTESLTHFILDDYASILAGMVDDEDITQEEAVAHLRTVNAKDLGTLICKHAHWADTMWDNAIETIRTGREDGP